MYNYVWILDIDWIASIFYFAGGNIREGIHITTQRIKNEFQPKLIVGALDSRPTFRHKLLENYKGDRPTKGEDFKLQFQHMINASDIPLLQMVGYEADDIIASYATQQAAEGEVAVMVSGDKDLRQCLQKNKVGLYFKRLRQPWMFYSIDDAEHDWKIPCEHFVDYQTLIGDSCDKIPGCHGIGPATACKLINKFGSLDNIFTNIDDDFITKPIRKKLLHEDFDRGLNATLVTLCTDLNLDECKPVTKETGYVF